MAKPDWLQLEPGEEFVGEYKMPGWIVTVALVAGILSTIVCLFTVVFLISNTTASMTAQPASERVLIGSVPVVIGIVLTIMLLVVKARLQTVWLTTKMLILKQRGQLVSVELAEITSVKPGSLLFPNIAYISRRNQPPLKLTLGNQTQEFVRELDALLASEARHAAKGGNRE
jgi:hypothetical protein